MKMIFQAYEDLVALGIPKEDASMLLPLGMHTKFVVKMNVRALLNMAQVRMCTRAYHEYRKLMNDIKAELSKLSPEWEEIASMMKPKCEITGYCEEHYTCGRKPKKDAIDKLVAKDKSVRIYQHTSGNGMTRYVCPRCEMPVDKLDAKYCSECGQKFEEWI